MHPQAVAETAAQAQLCVYRRGAPHRFVTVRTMSLAHDVSLIADARHLTFAPFAPVFAPPATRITCQSKRNNANRGEYANSQNHPKPFVVHCHLPRIAEHHRPLRRSAKAEFMREAREIGRGLQKSGSRHKPPPARRDAQKCEKLQKVPSRHGAARKDKLLESPNFLCGSVMFHLAAGQPCFMGWQNRETGRLGIEPEET